MSSIPTPEVVSGLHRLADLWEDGVFDEREFPTIRQTLRTPMVSREAVERLGERLRLPVEVSLDVAGSVHVRVHIPLGGIEAKAYYIVYAAEVEDAAL